MYSYTAAPDMRQGMGGQITGKGRIGQSSGTIRCLAFEGGTVCSHIRGFNGHIP